MTHMDLTDSLRHLAARVERLELEVTKLTSSLKENIPLEIVVTVADGMASMPGQAKIGNPLLQGLHQLDSNINALAGLLVSLFTDPKVPKQFSLAIETSENVVDSLRVRSDSPKTQYERDLTAIQDILRLNKSRLLGAVELRSRTPHNNQAKAVYLVD